MSDPKVRVLVAVVLVLLFRCIGTVVILEGFDLRSLFEQVSLFRRVHPTHRYTIDTQAAFFIVSVLVVTDLHGPISKPMHESRDVTGGIFCDTLQFFRCSVRVLSLDHVRAVRCDSFKRVPSFTVRGINYRRQFVVVPTRIYLRGVFTGRYIHVALVFQHLNALIRGVRQPFVAGKLHLRGVRFCLHDGLLLLRSSHRVDVVVRFERTFDQPLVGRARAHIHLRGDARLDRLRRVGGREGGRWHDARRVVRVVRRTVLSTEV